MLTELGCKSERGSLCFRSEIRRLPMSGASCSAQLQTFHLQLASESLRRNHSCLDNLPPACKVTDFARLDQLSHGRCHTFALFPPDDDSSSKDVNGLPANCWICYPYALVSETLDETGSFYALFEPADDARVLDRTDESISRSDEGSLLFTVISRVLLDSLCLLL